MGAKQFDYYIFVDYSENLIGYVIIDLKNISDILPKISKIKHYKEVNHKLEYLKAIRKSFERNHLFDNLLIHKIRKTSKTVELFVDIVEFIESKKNNSLFISIDDKQANDFERLIKSKICNSVLVVREGKLREGTIEHKLSLIIDNLLNLERTKHG